VAAVGVLFAAGTLSAERRAKFLPGSSSDIRTFAAGMLRARGELVRAATLDPRWWRGYAIEDAAALAMAGLMGADSVHERARNALADSTRVGEYLREGLAPFWAWRRDTASLAQAVRAARIRDRWGPVGGSDRRIETLNSVYGAYAALARGDTGTALRALESTPFDSSLEPAIRLTTLVPIYELRGRLREAFLILVSPLFGYPTGLQSVLAQLQLGRIAERLGEREAAARAYAFVADAWLHADPPFRPLYRQAVDGLRRTGGDVATKQVPVRR